MMDTDQMPALIPTLAQRVAELTKQRDELAGELQTIFSSIAGGGYTVTFSQADFVRYKSILSKLKD